ncbi:MAG: DUF4173 domain-containing protein [Fimbriimonas sp.]|nr:DUF4173 domain-containing protein [Fimbriimonas sp.]
MNDSKRLELSLKTLSATVFLGITGDLLLRDVPLGIGFSLYALAIAIVGGYLYRQKGVLFAKGVLWLVPPALLFTSLFAWRDSDTLKLLNMTCVAMMVGIVALRVRSGNLTSATIFDYPCRLVGRWIMFIADFIELLRLEGQWTGLTKTVTGTKAVSVVRGFLIATPLFIVFAALFASSDAVFNRLLSRAFSFDVGDVFSNLFVMGVCTWFVGGFFRRLFLAPNEGEMHGPSPLGPRLGLTEISIVFGTLNSLFLAFVAVQFRYFFGGHALVQKTAHLSYAEYAHQGFYELLVVALLGLCVLIGGHALVKRHESRDWRAFAVLALTLVTLIFVVMASAVTRMQIYVQAYGITEERLYATAILAWLTLVFCWFCATSLRSRPERFAPGAVASFLLIVAGLNVLNPDGLIVRENTMRSSAKVDGIYLANLGPDAIPDLVHALPLLNSETATNVKQALADRKKSMAQSDWRSWNYATQVAEQSLQRSGL